MGLSVERAVHARIDRVWAVLTDPPDWPRWTESMSEVRLLDGGLAPGSRVRIVQPRLPPMIWTVTELVPERELTWVTSAAGVITTGSHSLRPGAGGTTHLRLGLDHRGVLAPLVRGLLGPRTRRYVELEADGLRRAAEDE
ncbi:SRPBCC family protein [Pseudonocardia alni]|jgi:hypothetical protein|nr:SRPBCC family protein [Pseudonocardia antarctica]